jgi:putative hydrolase of the HAD superfamily
MKTALQAALIDVGGTLWPNSWPIRQTDGAGRLARVRASMPELTDAQVDAIVSDLSASARETHGGAPNPPDYTRVGADILVADSLQRHQVSPDPSAVARVRRAMAIPVADRIRPLPGAIELLAEINAMGLRCVIASNTYWRDAESYWEDFRLLGMADHVDAIVTSVDAGHLKPHPAVFELAMRTAGADAASCVYIGNKEDNDIEPALALGMRTILVYPDDPLPTSSRAHAVAPDLWTCARALKAMLGES